MVIVWGCDNVFYVSSKFDIFQKQNNLFSTKFSNQNLVAYTVSLSFYLQDCVACWVCVAVQGKNAIAFAIIFVVTVRRYDPVLLIEIKKMFLNSFTILHYIIYISHHSFDLYCKISNKIHPKKVPNISKLTSLI